MKNLAPIAAFAILSLTGFEFSGLGQMAQAQTAPAAAVAQPDWRMADPNLTVMVETTKGRIYYEMEPRLAPNHVARFTELIHQGFYNGHKFHRVIDAFMAQTGDPLGDGTGGSDGPDIAAEFDIRRGPDMLYARAVNRSGVSLGWIGAVPVTSQADFMMSRTADHRVATWANFCPGVLGAARGDDPNSANSQFFFMRMAYPSLDRRYTAFGRVLIGLDVVRALQVGEPPRNPDVMNRVILLADMPEATRPHIRVENTSGARFLARVQAQAATAGASFSNCDIIPQAEIIQ